MTDRPEGALDQAPERLTVGPSSIHWDGARLTITLDERGAPPAFGRVRGTVTITPPALTSVELPLTADGAHVWRPFAPIARIEVDLADQSWAGQGYWDANFGIRPLEADFRRWSWGRFHLGDGTALAAYDARLRDGTAADHSFAFDAGGAARSVPAPPRRAMGRTLWRIPQDTRGDAGTTPRRRITMLDAPFYVRTVADTVLDGRPATGMIETLDCDRFASPLIKPMLAVRVPRARR
ncbi:MAG: carotenoid 1,2-hydratase [Paracoccaceae bacterium]